MPCDRCSRVFGGLSAYDRHVDRRRDRCKTDAHLRRLGLEPDAAGVWRKPPMDPQTRLVDRRRLSRAERTRRGVAHSRVGAERGAEYQLTLSGLENAKNEGGQG